MIAAKRLSQPEPGRAINEDLQSPTFGPIDPPAAITWLSSPARGQEPAAGKAMDSLPVATVDDHKTPIGMQRNISCGMRASRKMSIPVMGTRGKESPGTYCYDDL
jgi:hypothetical protein